MRRCREEASQVSHWSLLWTNQMRAGLQAATSCHSDGLHCRWSTATHCRSPGGGGTGTHTEAVDKRRCEPGGQEEGGALGGLGLAHTQHHTLVLHILSWAHTGRTFITGTSSPWQPEGLQGNLPKLNLMRGERALLQSMGGYWKLVPTEASASRAVWTRAGWRHSGPASSTQDG